jgi:hypothetical protein
MRLNAVKPTFKEFLDVEIIIFKLILALGAQQE